ncbi:hypothetical protein HPY86_07350 [candidate division WOR-3 bacterium]|nr:hypothetical protein [candidate division WOR-3 bacterium]
MKNGLSLVILLILNQLLGAVENETVGAGNQAIFRAETNAQSEISGDAFTIPRLLSYQGKITDSLGIPVPDSDYSLTFRLYAQESGGTPCWNETQTVAVRNGLFSVLLGAVNPITTIPNSGVLYLGMQIGANPELTPRQRIVSSAYAFKADTANYALMTVGNEEKTWMRGTPDSVLYTVHQLGISRGGSDNMLYGDIRYSHTNLGVACTTGTPGANYGYCTVSGGFANRASDLCATVGGGGGNIATGSYATVAGGSGNEATGSRSTVGGGRHNIASGTNATVAGGKYAVASGYCASVIGGVDNIASGGYATVAGGSGNIASGYCAMVTGSHSSVASGSFAAVPGGVMNFAGGTASLAAGYSARANHSGCFVWSDTVGLDMDTVCSTGPNQWRARASGGVWFFSDRTMSTGVYLAPGSNSWSSISDDKMSVARSTVNNQAVLERIATLRVEEYSFPGSDKKVRHIGPRAQEFYATLGYGDTASAINLADMDGVLIAAIQALYEENKRLRAAVDTMRIELENSKAIHER